MAMVVKDDEGQFKCPCCAYAGPKWNVERHMKNCKKVKAAALNVDEAAVAELKESHEAKDALLAAAKTRIEELTAENASLKAENKELKARHSTRTTINNNNITMNIVHLSAVQKIHPTTGKATWEPLDVLPDEALVQPLLSQPETALCRYVEMKYFTGNGTPSIQMPNVSKPRELRVVQLDRSGTKRWASTDTSETIDWLVEKGLDELDEEYDAMTQPAYANWANREGLRDEGFDKMPAFKKMKREVQTTIIQHSRR